MKTFRVYKHPTRGPEAVKVGFSWPAFFFNIVWMLVKQLWALSLLWFGLYFVIGLMKQVTDTSEESGAQALVYLLLSAAYLALNLLPGFKGNAWRSANLQKRGYELAGEARAETPDAAVAQVAKVG